LISNIHELNETEAKWLFQLIHNFAFYFVMI